MPSTFDDLFYTRDLEGNESEDPPSSDDEAQESDVQDEEESQEDIEMEDNLAIPPAAPTEGAESSGLPYTPDEERVLRVFGALEDEGFTLAQFLDTISWSPHIRDIAKIRNERTRLLHDELLPSILQRWGKPPRSSKSRKSRPEGASKVINAFAKSFVTDTIRSELKQLSTYMRLSTEQDISKQFLLESTFDKLSERMQSVTPTLWEMLGSLCKAPSQRQESRRTTRDPLRTVTTIVSMILYMQNHHFCRLQKLFAVYFKFKGVSAKGFDTLHALGLTMSHKWTCNAVERISLEAMQEVRSLIDIYPWVITYDNINIPFRVFSQRTDNQSEFGNGTAATVYVKPDAKALPDNINELLQEKRAEGIKNPLTALDIFDLAEKAHPRIIQQQVYTVLKVLLDSPEFKTRPYYGRNDSAVQPPEPVDALPRGAEHTGLQYLLGSVGIPEAKYEDNLALVDVWLAQLGFDTPEKRRKLSRSLAVVWNGDQLTADRLRGLFKFRAQEANSYERLDFSVFVFGWLHLQMAFANSLHKQYEGTSQSRGLKQAFQLLKKKGLAKVLTKGPFHHDLEEALYTVAEAANVD